MQVFLKSCHTLVFSEYTDVVNKHQRYRRLSS